MKAWIYGGSLLLGLAIGGMIGGARDWGMATPGTRAGKAAPSKTARSPETLETTVTRMVSSASPAMKENVPLDQAIDILVAERKSPLRTRAFLNSRIQAMTSAQLTQALANGEVQTEAELREAARRLTAEDPEGTFTYMEKQAFRLRGMENMYTFLDTMLHTWADADAPAVMARLQKMSRGGSQQDWSLRFSDYWAGIDPAAAAANFDALVYLRNMATQGDMIFSDRSYAEKIVRSWTQRDEEGMNRYLKDLPAGPRRDALEKAAKALTASKP